MSFDAPIGGVDAEGLGGWNFVYHEEENLVLQEKGLKIMMRAPGPGESGFRYIEQENLIPREEIGRKERKRKIN